MRLRQTIIPQAEGISLASGRYDIKKRDRHAEDTEKEFVPRTKTCTLSHLLKTLLFYIIFYIALALMCYICMIGLLATISKWKPSVLSEQPGLSYAPYTHEKERFGLVEYNEKSDKDVDKLTKNIEQFMSKYGKLKDIGNCTSATSYGYRDRNPCVFFKVNRIIGFKVIPYSPGDNLKDLPEAIKKGVQEKTPPRIWFGIKFLKGKKSNKFAFYPSNWMLKENTDFPKMVKSNGKFYGESDYNRIIAVKFFNVTVEKEVSFIFTMYAKNIKIEEHIQSLKGVAQYHFSIKTD